MANDFIGTPTRTERRDASENRRRILETALRLFEQNGVEQVSMNQIASEAQIGPGTLYRRYRNKSELCQDLIRDSVVQLFDDVHSYLKKNQALPPGERLKGILSLFIRFREKKAQLLTGVEDPPSANGRGKRIRTPFYEELHQLFVRLYDEMPAGGQPRPNSIFKADMLLTALSRDFYLFQRESREYSPEEILEQLCLLFVP